jgi:hypothetical protein
MTLRYAHVMKAKVARRMADILSNIDQPTTVEAHGKSGVIDAPPSGPNSAGRITSAMELSQCKELSPTQVEIPAARRAIAARARSLVEQLRPVDAVLRRLLRWVLNSMPRRLRWT